MLAKSIVFLATSGARFAVVLDIDWKSRPIVLHTDLVKGLHLTEMSCKGVIVKVPKKMESEVAGVWNIDVSEVV